MRRSFFRPSMTSVPSSVSRPRSPVRSQPSRKGCSVSPAYPLVTWGPRTNTSPSSAIRTSVSGSGSPTVPIRLRPTRFSVTSGASVSPYASWTSIPSSRKDRRSWSLAGAEPTRSCAQRSRPAARRRPRRRNGRASAPHARHAIQVATPRPRSEEPTPELLVDAGHAEEDHWSDERQHPRQVAEVVDEPDVDRRRQVGGAVGRKDPLDDVVHRQERHVPRGRVPSFPGDEGCHRLAHPSDLRGGRTRRPWEPPSCQTCTGSWRCRRVRRGRSGPRPRAPRRRRVQGTPPRSRPPRSCRPHARPSSRTTRRGRHPARGQGVGEAARSRRRGGGRRSPSTRSAISAGGLVGYSGTETAPASPIATSIVR